ncbi:MAG: glycosyl transferase family 2 [Acidobacteria bacterium]|nr:glycosyl transferase family 2 [Acidobacteriota bacterium]
MVLPAVIPEDKREALEKVGTAEIVVGIPSYNHAETIGSVAEAVQAGLEQHFPSVKSLIIHSDGGSTDGTPERVVEAMAGKDSLLQVPYPAYPAQKLSTPYHGIPGKEYALLTFFQLSQQLGAKACVVVSPDQQGITPDWVASLAHPILEKSFDLASPCYLRSSYDGAITTGIVYPCLRALYGKRIRDPLGDDWGFSQRFMTHALNQDAWDREATRLGIEIWAVTEAICGGFSICEVRLGPRIHSAREQASDASDVLSQVIGSLFTAMESKAGPWQRTRHSAAVPVLGEYRREAEAPGPVEVERMTAAFRLGYHTLREIWGMLLPPATMLEVKKLANRAEEDFRLADGVWARIVYDFALGHRLRVINRDHLLRSLTPLYLGWLASFILQTRDAGPQEIENRVESLCLAYEAQKPYLISRWRWPDRFNP